MRHAVDGAQNQVDFFARDASGFESAFGRLGAQVGARRGVVGDAAFHDAHARSDPLVRRVD